ncbi:unnamed protein product [Colias eurytheme]|nr:unnamed protein product [Colias eurytheme]
MDNIICKRCDENVLDGAICSLCQVTYHYYCVSLTEVGWRRLGNRQSSWMCPECRKSPLQVGMTSKNCTSQDDTTPYRVQLTRIEEMLAPLTSLPGHVEQLRLELNDLTSKFNANVIEEVYTRLADIDQKLSVVESLKDELKRSKAQIASLGNQIQTIHSDIAKKDTIISNLEKKSIGHNY